MVIQQQKVSACELLAACSDCTQRGVLKQSGHLTQIGSATSRVKGERNEREDIQAAWIARKLGSYLKTLFSKPKKELKLVTVRKSSIKPRSPTKALGAIESFLMKRSMVRCLGEARGSAAAAAQRCLLGSASTGMWKEWAGLLSGFPYENMHTLPADVPGHFAHRSNSSEQPATLHCSRLSP